MPRRNTNCLAGIKCPSCGSLGPFDILMPVWVRWTDEGPDADECPQDWDYRDGEKCQCVECGYSMNSIEPFEEKDEDEEENPSAEIKFSNSP